MKNTLAELLKTNDPDIVLKYLGEKQADLKFLSSHGTYAPCRIDRASHETNRACHPK